VLKSIIFKNLSESIFERLLLFAKLTHTIGNMVLVPKKLHPYTPGRQTFNTARAIRWKDYFDLSLQWILNNEDPLWNVKTVKTYVKLFELRDYVTEDLKIIPLLESHRKIIEESEKV